MQLQQSFANHQLSLYLSGEFSISDHRTFGPIISQIEQGEGIQSIVLYMEKLTYLDSAAIGILLVLRDKASKRNIPVTIVGLQGDVAAIFQLTQLNTLFTIQP